MDAAASAPSAARSAKSSRVEFVDAISKTAADKVLRKDLRARESARG